MDNYQKYAEQYNLNYEDFKKFAEVFVNTAASEHYVSYDVDEEPVLVDDLEWAAPDIGEGIDEDDAIAAIENHDTTFNTLAVFFRDYQHVLDDKGISYPEFASALYWDLECGDDQVEQLIGGEEGKKISAHANNAGWCDYFFIDHGTLGLD